MIEQWVIVWNQYKDILKPNRKSGQEIIDFLSEKYVISELHSNDASEAVRLNVTMNQPFVEKLPDGTIPQPKTFFVENQGNGSVLYQNIDDVFKSIERIFVGVDISSGFYMVEGCSMLWDELCAFQGLDESDIQNPFCVAEYISCLKRFDKLNELLK